MSGPPVRPENSGNNMKSNLLSRFILIFGAIALALFCIFSNGLKGGIDLSGGTDLIYQLEVPPGYKGDPNILAQQVISVLRRRVDPGNVHNLVWRVLAGERIEIQMPLASAESRKAQSHYQTLVDQLLAENVMPSQIGAAMAVPGNQRQTQIKLLAQGNAARKALLETLAKRYDALAGARKIAARFANDPQNMPAHDIALLNNTTSAYQNTLEKLLAFNVNVQHLANLLSSTYGKKNPQAQAALADLIQRHSDRAKLIQQIQAAYAQMRQHSAGLDSPQELERMLRGAGVLDFRITVGPQNADARRALAQLGTKGPHNGYTPAGTAWFEVDPRDGKDILRSRELYVVGQYEGQHYILLYTNSARALTHSTNRAHWQVSNAQLQTDPQTGELAVGFNLDTVGAAFMRTLTSQNIGRDMAILLDGKAITAPTIQSTIAGSGQITLGMPSARNPAKDIQQQGQLLVQTLNAGSLPATLQSQPISVQTIGATLGADNLKAGLRSAVIAVIVVLGFMFIYYTITGLFADVALMLNLLLTLGVMALLHATFTLPGIAGVVLTLGMAVDANILINERIREEIHKGASLWLAVKQGYDRVFWTIFDANLTTSLTSIVLIFMGSEDVKGFGITLLIGLAVHMFTALFVTRTLMIAAIRAGVMRKIDDLSIQEYFRDLFTFTWLKGRWPFMRVFTVTNFDWIGKRRIFWVVSAVIMIAGIITFVARGNKKYDTEFNGGTQVTLQLRPGKQLSVAAVRKRVEAIGRTNSKLKALRHATVYSVGTQHNQFVIITSVVNPPAVKAGKTPGNTATAPAPVQQLTNALESQFANDIKVTRKLSFAHVAVRSRHIQDLLDDGAVMPITHANLTNMGPGLPNADIGDFRGGVAIFLRHITPAQSTATIASRIRAMSQEPDFAALQYRPFRVIALQYAPAAPGQKPAATDAVVVATDPSLLYRADNTGLISQWKTQVAAPEWRIVRTALTTSGGLAGVTSFAPQVASEARLNAVMSVLVSLLLIVAYVWIRFGGVRYGFGVIFSLLHDAIVAVAATVLAVYIHRTGWGHFLLVDNFKINMTMIAAYLTIIGYSVNDTIVIFDRVRENRGRSRQPLTAKLVNDSINQCFGRTIWTTFTVFSVVLILYIWGGQGVHGFAYAMLIGVLTGAYSTLAIASPMLLHMKDAVVKKPARENPYKAGDNKALEPGT
jgi:SecD/SecF fusion protein